jgi:hypothetical protein
MALVKACSYCGRQNTEDASWCPGCGTKFPPAATEDRSKAGPEFVASSPPDGLTELDVEFEVVEGFSRPNWASICHFVNEYVAKDDLLPAWQFIAETWLQQLSRDLGGGCRVSRSANFLCLCDLNPEATRSMLAYAESVIGIIRDSLRGAAWTGYHGPHVLLVFSDPEDYYAYVSYYFSEGSHILSGGVFIRDGYSHIALPYCDARSAEHVLIHELVHNLLCHLHVPLWLNEGLAMVIERRVQRQPFPVDHDLVERHAAHWNEQNIQAFWAGTSFDEPGENSELSYSLAEIFVALLSDKGPDFIDFIVNADWRDAGQDAALGCLGTGLGELAAGFLGPGNWRPQRKAISDSLQAGKK